jgi:V8-like Glu-specific endopeptidase
MRPGSLRHYARFAAATTLLLSAASPTLADEASQTTEFGVVFHPSRIELSKARSRQTVDKKDFNVSPRYYRLLFVVDNPEGAPWTVTIRSPDGQLLSTFDQSDERCQTKAGCWTIRLGSKLPVIRFDTPSDTTVAKVPTALYMPEKVAKTFYSPMQGSRDELISALGIADDDERSTLQDKAENLGMFIASGPATDGSQANWCCSGVRLSTDLFMTNWHCGAVKGLPDSAFWNNSGSFNSCQASLVDLSWDEDLLGREYSCRSVEFQDKTLDVAILRLGALADGPPLTRPLSLPVLSANPVQTGDTVMVLHHPACEPKSVTRNCSVQTPSLPSWTGDPAASEFSHNCTTENGSSGGPVYSANGELIGLHHLGAKQGEADKGNFAVGLDSILAAIKQRNAALYQEITAR